MPHFTSTELMTRYARQHSLHFTYYLTHARPSFAAFAFVVANCRLESQKLTRRLVTHNCSVASRQLIFSYFS